MAQNGGGVSTRRILASTAAASRLASSAATAIPPSAAVLSRPPPASSPVRLTTTTTRHDDQNFVTLGQPRPDVARRQNEYIETPLRPHQPKPSAKVESKPSNQKRTEDRPVVPDVLRHTRTILAQPSSVTTFKKDVIKSNVVDSDGSTTDSSIDDHADSIICAECGRCKCESCKSPKRLPSKWLCQDGCLCSAESVVDYASCMCCVKGLFYHCANMDSDDGSCVDRPCSCGPHRRCTRWTSLSVLSLLLPCLWCYWPMRGCIELCELCYSKVTNHGCTCSPNKMSLPSNKGLLESD